MTDRPIIFSGPMVRALLDGRKTMTRRLLSPQPEARETRPLGFVGSPAKFAFTLCHDGGANSTLYTPVRFAPGDRLWVREHWRSHVAYDDLPPRGMGGDEPVRYEADGHLETRGYPFMNAPGRHRQGMHMPRWASRLTLVVTDVKVERLQDISAEDAKAEGITDGGCRNCGGSSLASGGCCYDPRPDFRESFVALWNSIHGQDAWHANPWVVAISFTVHRCNIDNMEAAA